MTGTMETLKQCTRAVVKTVKHVKVVVKTALIDRWRNDPPEDPFAYVPAPKKPRLPHLSATAVAEWPEP